MNKGKDFTDWNGKKRKSQYECPPNRPTYRSTVKKRDKRVGFKTKVDRYRALVTELKRYKEWRARDWARYRENGSKGCMFMSKARIVGWVLEDMRKMKAILTAEGIYPKVVSSL